MTKKLQILQDSLTKKEDLFSDKLQNHFATTKESNGQPLNDKRNGTATLNRWERQNDALRRLNKSIEKTKSAIENEQGKITHTEHVKQKFPPEILYRIESGELIQWRKYPNILFVAGVDKARIYWDEKNKVISHKYARSMTNPDMYKKFAKAFNSLLISLQKAQHESTAKESH